MLILYRLEKKCLLSAFVERIKVKKVSNMITYNRCNFILSITGLLNCTNALIKSQVTFNTQRSAIRIVLFKQHLNSLKLHRKHENRVKKADVEQL